MQMYIPRSVRTIVLFQAALGVLVERASSARMR